MSQIISFAEAKQLTLDRLRQRMEEMSVAERSRPTYIINFNSYSIISLISAVERETEDGIKFVYQQMEHLNIAVE